MIFYNQCSNFDECPKKDNSKWLNTEASQGNYNTVVILIFEAGTLM